ncbi:C-type lectin domain family 4 member E isoform X2 [Oryzias melastigma]|uniref:C-type lectin domain family 4 member E isoform X2 n=1 Tax=Oryzias melastigma TaxID=30732 RepID=UPI00168D30A9|nr:C-type lectin domain family 4 member E isoform X2 [Oryzias melastigma]
MDGRLFNASLRKFGTGFWNVPNSRIVLVFLGLLNAVLFIIAVGLGVMCAGVREDSSLKDSHSAALKLIGELTDLRSNHSDLIEAEEKTKRLLQMKIQDHVKLKEQIKQLTAQNIVNQRQLESLKIEKENLQTNITALGETCGRCPPSWIHLNSSCYFFSYIESSSVMKSWPFSRMDCIRREADLIVIDSPEEQKFVSNTINSIAQGNVFWIGLNDKETEGTWVWINNVREVERRYWMNGQPDGRENPYSSRYGYYGRDEDCVVTTYSVTNPWKTRSDASCLENQYYWICERKSN